MNRLNKENKVKSRKKNTIFLGIVANSYKYMFEV